MKPDAPREVREGEELDLARLADWLRAQGLPGEALSQEQYTRGHSNLTYLIHSGAREWVLRRPPHGTKAKSAHDMPREARLLQKLHPVFPLAPKVVAICEDESVLGAPFYLMVPRRGAILRGPHPKGVTLAPEQVSALCGAFVKTLADLHAVDYAAAGLSGKPEGYVRRQVEGWTGRWHAARIDDVPDVDAIAAWLAARIPREAGPAFLHNDFKYDNLVLDPADPTRVVGVLDWEMSTVGDPLMDLGTAIGYWVEEGDDEALKAFAFGPTFLPGSWSRARLIEEYGRVTGRDVSGMLFYGCFALFKTAVVAQQIYKRYALGQTKDERFAGFGLGVQILARRAVEAAASGKL